MTLSLLQLKRRWVRMLFIIMLIISSEGVDYEQQGISPDIDISYHATMLEEGKDNALDCSISVLNPDVVTLDDEDDDKNLDDDSDCPCFITSCWHRS